MSHNTDSTHDDIDPSLREYVNSAGLAANYDEFFSDTPLFRFDCLYLAAVLDFPHPPERSFSLLDLGCGTGRHLALAAGNGCHAVGVDLNPHMLAKAEQNLTRQGIPFSAARKPGKGGTARLVQGDIMAPPLDPDESFDAIIMMFSTLGLVLGKKRRENFIRDIAKRLKPGGRMVFHVHNELRAKSQTPLFSRQHLEEIRLKAIGKLEAGDHMQYNYRGVLDLRLHFFTPDELYALFSACGLRVVDFLYLNEQRDGPSDAPNRDRSANGFLMTVDAG